MKVVLYARTSTTGSEKDLSITDQARQLEEYCQQHDHEITARYEDEGCSGADDNRPGLREMLDSVESGQVSADAVLVTTASRFFRNAIDAGVWKRQLGKHGVRVIAITQETEDPNSPTAQLLDTIFAAIDEHERVMIGCHDGGVDDD